MFGASSGRPDDHSENASLCPLHVLQERLRCSVLQVTGEAAGSDGSDTSRTSKRNPLTLSGTVTICKVPPGLCSIAVMAIVSRFTFASGKGSNPPTVDLSSSPPPPTLRSRTPTPRSPTRAERRPRAAAPRTTLGRANVWYFNFTCNPPCKLVKAGPRAVGSPQAGGA